MSKDLGEGRPRPANRTLGAEAQGGDHTIIDTHSRHVPATHLGEDHGLPANQTRSVDALGGGHHLNDTPAEIAPATHLGEGRVSSANQCQPAEAQGGDQSADDTQSRIVPATNSDETGHSVVDAQLSTAPSSPPGGGHNNVSATQAASADSGQGGDQSRSGNQAKTVPAALIAQIRYWHRLRCYAMEQRKRADLALGSFLRTALGWSRALPDSDRKRINDQAQDLIALGEAEARAIAKKKPADDIDEPAYVEWKAAILASIAARQPFNDVENDAKKQMAALAKQLPVYAWAEPIRGFGEVSLAIIVAEAGDLSNYANPAKLWKRMGLAVMDGTRQGGLLKSASKDDWIAHGYNRQRRSRVWNIGDALIKGNADGEYRAVYLAEKEKQRAKAEAAGLTVAPAAKIPEKRQAEFMSDGHIHRMAQRYMEKRLLKNLWGAWRRAEALLPPVYGMPASNTDAATSPSLSPNTRMSRQRRARSAMPPNDAVPATNQDAATTPAMSPTETLSRRKRGPA